MREKRRVKVLGEWYDGDEVAPNFRAPTTEVEMLEGRQNVWLRSFILLQTGAPNLV